MMKSLDGGKYSKDILLYLILRGHFFLTILINLYNIILEMVLLTDTSNISFIEHSGQNTKNRYNIKNQTFNSVYNEKSSYFVDAERFNYTIGTVLIANLIKNTHIKSIFSCDVLIIGGGSAGLRSAIEAHDSCIENVLIISQSRKGDPHTGTCKRWHQCSARHYGS